MFRRLRPFFPFVLFSLLIFSTVDIARALEKGLTTRFGPGVFNAVYILVGSALGYGLWRTLQSARREWWRAAGILALAALYLPLLMNLKFAVEKIHYVEYGFLALLAVRPCARLYPLFPALLLSLCLVYLAGLTDEFIQHLHPGRVGEWRDAGINLTAGALGLCGFALVSGPATAALRTSVAAFSGAFFLTLAATWAFLEAVHGFGFAIRPTPSVTFHSALSPLVLKEIDGRLARGEPVGNWARGIYGDEARRHLFQRDYYAGDWRGCNENLVLETCYGNFLMTEKAAWDSAAPGRARQKSSAWTSRVSERMITQVSALWARVAFVTALFAVLLFGFMAGKKRGLT